MDYIKFFTGLIRLWNAKTIEAKQNLKQKVIENATNLKLILQASENISQAKEIIQGKILSFIYH